MKQAIKRLKEAYVSHDVNEVDNLVNTLFDGSIEPAVFGTSNGEVFVSIEEIKNLFLDDFTGEYPLDIALNTLYVTSFGPFSWVEVSAGLKYSFSNSNETYSNFLNYTKAITKKETSATTRATEILVLLSHLMSDRKDTTRDYLWDVMLEGVAYEDKFQAFTFSLPIDTYHPDVRLDQSLSDVRAFEYEQERLRASSQKGHLDDQIISNTLLKQLAGKDVFLDPQTFVTHRVNDYAWVLTHGFYKTHHSLDERLMHTFDQLLHSGDNTPKQTLFALRRELVNHMYHQALGEIMHVPFRYFAIYQLVNGEWTEVKASITYPFNQVLEEKTDYATPLNHE